MEQRHTVNGPPASPRVPPENPRVSWPSETMPMQTSRARQSRYDRFDVGSAICWHSRPLLRKPRLSAGQAKVKRAWHGIPCHYTPTNVRVAGAGEIMIKTGFQASNLTSGGLWTTEIQAAGQSTSRLGAVVRESTIQPHWTSPVTSILLLQAASWIPVCD
ncbi:hypothetical protein HDV57DRAFT_67640 [Trichoderma longibrachiatum]|uniref:Uncharacterized protein n=1 Tax=Trichoderma longibrachiatum ATCC 18648 TaxID=983965 RepID=A0A2T4CF78_TRILO|nr:hypothetical protein M440DRAFT_1118583 [Trichoderma longibrachiatum ATCC 18648]